MSSLNYKISVIISVVSLAGCMSQEIVNTSQMDDAVLRQVANSTQTPQQVCEAASSAVATANKEELHFYAPLHLDQAADALQEGLDQIKNKETQADGVKNCFKVNKLVNSGIDVKAKVKTSLNDSLAELEMLKKVDEGKKFTDDIQDYVDDVVDLVKNIEAGKMNVAMQDQAELLKDMLELEVEIIIDKNLSPVEAMIEKAEDVDADELAEKTFEKAENELDSAKKFIQANYRDSEQVNEASVVAMRLAKHAFYVAKEVEELKALKPEAAEERVLYIESLLERVNEKFNQDVIIGNSLYEQASIIGQRLNALIEDKESLNRENALLIQKCSEPAAAQLSVDEVTVGSGLVDVVPLEENTEVVGVSQSVDNVEVVE